MKICVLVVLVLVGLHLSGTRFIGLRRARGVDYPEPCDSGLRVALVVSSVASEDGDTRFLEVHWENAPLEEGDYLAVYEADPTGNHSAESFPESVFSTRPTQPTGYVNTEVFSFQTDGDMGFETRCFGHWVAYLRPSPGGGPPNVLASSCILTRPTWMYDLRAEIGQRWFRDLFIPGTHDSGAYGEGEGDRITKYTYTQEETILNQLIFGIRYLDIRVGYYPPAVRNDNVSSPEPTDRVPDEDVFYINHGIIRIRPLKEAIDDVREFLSSTNEVVIFDLQEFPVGFGSSDTSLPIHVRLMSYLERELGAYAANVSMGGGWWDTPMNMFWKAGKRLVIGYDNSDAVEEAARLAEQAGKGRGGSIIWRSVSQKWGDVRSAADLRNYLSSVLSSPPAYVWSAMAELTPSAWDVITDGPGGLRKMADAVNRNVTEWFGGTWGRYANIISTDYFRGNEIVEAAIKWNHWRAVWSTECRKL